MTFLPIVERELRVASRRSKTYYSRLAPAGFAALCSLYLLWISRFVGGGGGFVIFQMLTACLVGIAVTSGWANYDTISREKREGTIGFLFLTDLKGFDIVLGKLAASAVPAIYAAIGVLPAVSIALLAGGVSGRQFWEVSLAILNLFFLAHSVAILGSAIFRDQRNAAGFPVLVLILYICLFAAAAIAEEEGWHATSSFLQIFNPAHTLSVALSPPRRTTGASYGISLATVHLTGWLFVGLASVILPHRWQDKPKKTKRLRERWEQWRFGNAKARAALRQKLMGVNPFMWLVSRRQSGPATIWIILGFFATCVFSIAAWVVWKGHETWEDIYDGIFITVIVLLHLALKAGIAVAASEPLQAQRVNGGLETVLCCTPLSTEDILSGQWLAIRRLLLKPAIAVVIFGLVLIGIALFQVRDDDNRDLIWFLSAATLVLIPDMLALGWVSMWTTMSQPQTPSGGHAIGAVISVCIIPWVFFGVINGCLDLMNVAKPISPWIFWIIAASICDFLLCRIGRRQLQKNF